MRENVDVGPSRKIEQCPGRQEVEAGLRQLVPILAGQAFVEASFQSVQVAYGLLVLDEELEEEGTVMDHGTFRRMTAFRGGFFLGPLGSML